MDPNSTLLDAGAAGRKRAKRQQPNKNESSNKSLTQSQFSTANNQQIGISTLSDLNPEESALANTNNNNTTNTNNSSLTVECRRSSRKKVIKFDVRDLLNKNRKPHKIQIEARIDSNAPSTNKGASSNMSSEGLATAFIGTSSSEEISVKKKNFMEKSAFFRRFSISAEQPKQPPQLPIPPVLLNKTPVIQDCIEQMKIKPSSSLILAQMESTSSTAGFTRKQSTSAKMVASEKLPKRAEETVNAAPQQRKRGRPPKIKTPLISHSDTTEKNSQISRPSDHVSQLTPEKARNWKEYKAALQQTTTTKGLPTVSCTNVVSEIVTVSTTSENTEVEASLKAFEKMDVVLNTLTTPDITEATEEEIVAECVDSLELCETANSIQQEVQCLSPVSPIIGKTSLSRTSSSSESENCSERSINSSGGSSTRSYRSGDKLRVNLKRMSLHKTKLNPTASYSNQQLGIESDVNEDVKTQKNANTISTADITKSLLLEWEEDLQETLTNEKKGQLLEESQEVIVNVGEDQQIDDNLIKDTFQIEDVFNAKQSPLKSNQGNVEGIIKGTEISSDASVIIIDDSSISNSEIYTNLKSMDIVEDKDAEFNQSSSEMKSPLLAGPLQDVTETEVTAESKQIDEEIVNEFHPVAAEMNNEITQETTASSSTAVTEDLISEAVVIPVSPTPEECPVADEQSEVLKINEISASRQAPEMPSAVVEDTKHVITIPKKRGRKPRFRNLHEPELLEKVVASTITKKEIVESSISNNVDLRTMQDAAEYNIKVQPISGAEVISSRTAHIPIQRSEHQYFEKNALTKSAESEEYEAQIAPNVDAIKTTEYEEEKKSTTTEHQLLPLDVITTQQSDLEIEEEKKSKSNDVNSGLEIEVVDHQIVTDARSSHAELKEESKSLSTLLMNEITERDIDMIEKKDDSFSLTLNDNCQTIRPELDTNVIHQVDIETNMLLDILRQVQTNTEANELRVKNKTYTGAITEALSNEKVSSNEGKPASCNLWKKVDTDSTSSNSSSIRSETASPLTFKKVIRRCDRRNRRSEESTNKTLEETFAEITALSSKITLEVTASDLAEEKKDMVDAGEDVSKGNAEAAEEESLIGETKKEKEKILTTAAEENLIVSLEKPKSQEAKVAIGKRGRKPKNKPIYIDPSLPITTLTSKEENETKNRENLVNREDVEEPGKCNKMATKHISIPISLTGISDENLTPFQSEDDVSKKEEFPFDSNIAPITFDNNVIGSQEGLSTSPVGNENNVTKFSNQKRDLSANRKQDVKNSVKKQSKKLKSNQEDVLLLTNEDSTSKSSKSSSSAPKRGRKPKNQSHSLTEQRTTASAINSGKRKGKKDAKVTSVEDIKKPNVYPESYEDSQKDVDVQNCGATADKMLDEKSAKRKRQKRLKKDFEAALIDDFNNKESLTLLLGLNESTYSVSSPKITKEPLHTETIRETISVSTVCNAATPDTEEDPDPLKDIEKFIEAGVNLLKKDYKIDEDSMDGCIPNKSVNKETVAGDVEKVFTESALQTVSKITQEYTEVTNVVNTFETPVDTPIATPSATPPPKSPINNDAFTTPDVEEIFGVRRSHRIKQITKAPKALVGRGLVRDRERFSIKDDVETKSHYTLDDHLTDLAEVEAKNAKFLKEMEERLSNFQ
uniref:Uncharacterized protein n=1 Tax=Glossina pallidipes TaxID=7398 RepID=A0A1B0A7P7_GLOPL